MKKKDFGYGLALQKAIEDIIYFETEPITVKNDYKKYYQANILIYSLDDFIVELISHDIEVELDKMWKVEVEFGMTYIDIAIARTFN